MNRNIIMWALAVLAAIGVVAAERKSGSRGKDLGSPFSPDDKQVTIGEQNVKELFEVEMKLRDRLLEDRFFAKPLSDQKSRLSPILSYLWVDPLFGARPAFLLRDEKDMKAQGDFGAWKRYTQTGGVSQKLGTLLQKSQGIFFNRPATMRQQGEFYNNKGGEASVMLFYFDDIMKGLTGGAVPFLKEHYGEEGLTWEDLLKACKVDVSYFHCCLCVEKQGDSARVAMAPFFSSRLQAAKEHGDTLPPKLVEQWVAEARAFMEDDLAKFRKTVELAAAQADNNPRVLALKEKDLKIVEALEKMVKGMIFIRDQFNNPDIGCGRMRTGKTHYRYTKGRYALPDMPTDTVPDHEFLVNRVLFLFNQSISRFRVHARGITAEQRKKAEAWRKKHLKADTKALKAEL